LALRDAFHIGVLPVLEFDAVVMSANALNQKTAALFRSVLPQNNGHIEEVDGTERSGEDGLPARTKSPRVELFDYENDPEETRNHAEAQPEIVRELLARLEAGPRP
jgi:hypothetical protein